MASMKLRFAMAKILVLLMMVGHKANQITYRRKYEQKYPQLITESI